MMVVCIAWQKRGREGILPSRTVYLVVYCLGTYLPEVCCKVLIVSCTRERDGWMDIVGGTMENNLVSGGREGSVVERYLHTWREVEDMTCTSSGR